MTISASTLVGGPADVDHLPPLTLLDPFGDQTEPLVAAEGEGQDKGLIFNSCI